MNSGVYTVEFSGRECENCQITIKQGYIIKVVHPTEGEWDISNEVMGTAMGKDGYRHIVNVAPSIRKSALPTDINFPKLRPGQIVSPINVDYSIPTREQDQAANRKIEQSFPKPVQVESTAPTAPKDSVNHQFDAIDKILAEASKQKPVPGNVNPAPGEVRQQNNPVDLKAVYAEAMEALDYFPALNFFLIVVTLLLTAFSMPFIIRQWKRSD